jgi:alkyl sulfatase BDS1-like metallo-beta-lactamase superfamily hydrolase
MTLSRPALDRVPLGETTVLKEVEDGELEVEPDQKPLADLLGFLDTFSPWFNMVEP